MCAGDLSPAALLELVAAGASGLIVVLHGCARPADAAELRELTDGPDSETELNGIPTGVPRLTAHECAGGGVCARTCPAEALTLTSDVLAEANEDWEAIAQFQLTFDPGRCTDCGKCLQVCPESALERSGDYLWSALLAEDRVSLRVAPQDP